MNAAMIRNTCKMWYIWRGTDLLFSTEFAMISITALRRGNSVGKGRMFCAEYDPGHDARQPVAADRIVCCPCAAQPDISAALQHGGYADRRPFSGRGRPGRRRLRLLPDDIFNVDPPWPFHGKRRRLLHPIRAR